MIGAGDKIRTYDRLITNQLLYQLSYASVRFREQAFYAISDTGAMQCMSLFRLECLG